MRGVYDVYDFIRGCIAEHGLSSLAPSAIEEEKIGCRMAEG